MKLSDILKSVSKRLRLGQTTNCSTPISDPISSTTTTTTTTTTTSSGFPSTSPFTNPSFFFPTSDSATLLISSEDEEEPTPGESLLALAAARLSRRELNPYQQIVEQILRKVSQLEHTIYEDHQNEFRLRMALERQTERVQELSFSLDTEKKRNGRLVQLLHGIDTSGGEGSEPEERFIRRSPVKPGGDLYDSISPLLMQQRYDELSVSHRQSCRQLAKKEKALKILKSETEELQSKYEQLFDEYRTEQRRFEMLCSRYMEAQMKKKQQIYNLKNTLGHASECIYHAQVAIDECCQRNKSQSISPKNLENFNKNLSDFMNALRNCCCLQKVHELQHQQQQQLRQKEPSLEVKEIKYTQIPSDDKTSPGTQQSSKQSHRSRRRQRNANR
ncbi:uncharacterized protein LOC110176194 [Drosophila serrata]|uniref:uncharacterized protein LOC110176194 n=1 Tax=Drosophila serrata TaxID=7274 RepID=UPI000A1D2C2C|nr:uncharacterized protein LOC110176194 [Drosophila serrata]